MKRIVVTGAGGFIGSYVCDALERRGDAVDPWTRGTVDVTQAADVAAAVERVQPDAVIHLAAQSFPSKSWQHPAETFRVNVLGAIALLEAVRTLTRRPRVLLAGSSAEYGARSDGGLLDESAPLSPDSPYGSSKAAVNELAQLYARRYSLDIVRFRPFFLIGPGKVGDVSSDFARRVVAIERGAPPVLRVGDLSAVRDMIDVRDGVDAILRILDCGASGDVYNVCGGTGTRIAEIVETFRTFAAVPFSVEPDPALLRPLEHTVKVGDPAKIRALGWAPTYTLAATLSDILNHTRSSYEPDPVAA